MSDLAFEAIDQDGSGDLDADELSTIMTEISTQIGVKPPSIEDIKAILKILDDSEDGKVDKDEFFKLIMMILTKMVQLEDEFTTKVNDNLRDAPKDTKDESK